MSGQPALRFPEFEGEWERKQLSELGTLHSGTGFPEAEQGGTEGTPFFKVSDMNLEGNEDRMRVANNYVTTEQQTRNRWKPINREALIFAKVGAAIFLERKRKAKNFLLDNNMMAFVPSEALDLNFAAETLRRINFGEFVQTGSLPSYNASTIGVAEVYLPPKPEQTKIAAFLAAVDARIAAAGRERAGLGRFKAGLLGALLSRALRFVRDDGGAFPDWDERLLGDVATRVRRKNAVGNTNVLTASGQGGLVRQDSYFNKGIASKDLSNYWLLQRGEFAYNRSKSVGYPAGAVKQLELFEAGVVSPLYICFAINDQNRADFYAHVFEGSAFASSVEQVVQVGARDHGMLNVSVEDFFTSVTVPVPHPDEQAKIAAALAALDRRLDLAAREEAGLRRFKAGLLQAMFA